MPDLSELASKYAKYRQRPRRRFGEWLLGGAQHRREARQMVISLLCPSRGRPENLRRLVASIEHTASRSDQLEMIAYLDTDDPSCWESAQILVKGLKRTTVIFGPRIVMAECWNRCFAISSGSILFQCADDIVFRTPDWDEAIERQFDDCPDRILFVHGRDGLQDGRLGTHGAVSRRWAEALGYFVPPYFSCDWTDTWLNEVADSLGRRRYLPEIFIEHMHPAAGKAEMDQTHLDRMARGERDNVTQRYIDTLPERQRDAEILRALMS